MEKYTMRIIEGSLTDPDYLKQFQPKILKKLENPSWGNLLEVELSLDEIKEVQKLMVRHFDSPEPWYMDGWAVGDRNRVICAFGADDGEGGRVFFFNRDDKKAFEEVVKYAISKGIPPEEIDFLE